MHYKFCIEYERWTQSAEKLAKIKSVDLDKLLKEHIEEWTRNVEFYQAATSTDDQSRARAEYYQSMIYEANLTDTCLDEVYECRWDCRPALG